MEIDQIPSPLLGWPYYFQGKSMDELGNALLCTTLELENTKMAVQEELRKRDDQLIHLKELLNKAFRERDEALQKCHRLLLEKSNFLLLQQHQHQIGPISGISSIEDEPRKGIDSNNGFSSSDCEESIVSSPVMDPIQPPLTQLHPEEEMVIEELVGEKALPEKGKLLEAVMKAGPLLQTLLLAGPLPQWRHPPPPLQPFQIPPVTISPQPQILHHQQHSLHLVTKKRVLCQGPDSPSPETKFQRVLLH